MSIKSNKSSLCTPVALTQSSYNKNSTYTEKLKGLQKTQPKKGTKKDEKISHTPLWRLPRGMTAQTLRNVLKIYQETNER